MKKNGKELMSLRLMKIHKHHIEDIFNILKIISDRDIDDCHAVIVESAFIFQFSWNGLSY